LSSSFLTRLTVLPLLCLSFFLFTAPPPPATSPLSLHDALPICSRASSRTLRPPPKRLASPMNHAVLTCASSMRSLSATSCGASRSEEHTSELQSLTNLVCRLLLEKKKNQK